LTVPNETVGGKSPKSLVYWLVSKEGRRWEKF